MAPPEPGMPQVAGGRVLCAVMRNANRLCPACQTSRCRNSDCSLLHQCAAVLRSGRVCGGHHTGAECRDRRRISPADADELGLRPEPAAKAQPVRLVEARQVVHLEPSSSSADRPVVPAGSQERRAKHSGPEPKTMLAKKAKAVCGTRLEPLTSWKPSHGGALRATDASAWQVARRSQEGYPGNAVLAYQFLCARLLLTRPFLRHGIRASFAISACVRYVQARREVSVGEQAGGRPCLLACSCPPPPRQFCTAPGQVLEKFTDDQQRVPPVSGVV